MRRLLASIAAASAVAYATFATPALAQTEITLWSHWAAEKIKRDYVEDAIKRFEEKKPGREGQGVVVREDGALRRAENRAARRAGPDIFYAEPDQVEYMENGFLLDLSELNWNSIEPGPRPPGAIRASPTASRSRPRRSSSTTTRRWSTNSASRFPESAAFGRRIHRPRQKGEAKGWTPMSLGVGDRPFPGAYLTHEALLQNSAPRITTSSSRASCPGPTRASSTP
jgi:multiple sugar transport system substrate-binding protein